MALIPISGVPSTYRVPGEYAEFLLGQGPSTAAAPARDIVFVMPKLSGSGTWAANTVYQVQNEAQAIAGAGNGCPLHRALRFGLNCNKSARYWALPYLPTSGMGNAAATLTVTWTTDPTAQGTTTLTICGEPCTVAFKANPSDTVTTIATKMAAVVNSRTWLPVTANNAAGVLTLTAKIAGASQNGVIRVRVAIDPGVGTSAATQNSSDVDALAGGADGATAEATNFSTALAAIVSSRKYYVGTSLTDATNLGALKTHLANKSYPIPGLRSVGIAASVDTLGNGSTIAVGRNYERLQIAWQKNSEHDPAELVANMAAVRQLEEAKDSAFNFDYYATPAWQIKGQYRDVDRPTGDDLNDAILAGLTPIQTNGAGGSYIVMSVNTRSKDSTGSVNDFRATETHRVSVGDEYIDTVLLRHSLTYRGKKLKDDEKLPNGQVNPNQRLYAGVVTPFTYKPFVFGIIDEFGGEKFQDIDGMKASWKANIDPNNGGRMEAGHDIKVVNLFHQLTLRIAETTPG